jgi:hypothetical protein
MGEVKTEATGLTEAEKETAEIRVDEEDHNQDVEEDPEEAEEKEGDKETEPTEDDKTADSESKGEEKKEPEKESATEEVDYSKPPPKGYVPLPAVQQERAVNKELKGQIATLQKTVELLQTQAPKSEERTEEGEFEGFKVLSQSEFDDLVEDDVEEATRYQNKLGRYNEHQRNQQQLQKIELARTQRVNAAINSSLEKIVTAVPGIHDEGSTIGNELFEFAQKNGFDGNYLNILTTPATRILTVDQEGNVSKESIPLAEGAASMISMLHKLYQSERDSDPEKLRSEIEAKVTEELRAKITQELLEKFKSEDPTGDFRSITDIPSGSNDDPVKGKEYTEEELFSVSPKDERKWLGG